MEEDAPTDTPSYTTKRGMPNFLTPQDEERLNTTYSKLKEEEIRRMKESFDRGELSNVTLEEATKIVEYAVESEVCDD